jgi:predicted TPR repeat methyltransferase
LSDWKSFWESDHSIYVNSRHKDVHCRDIARHIAAFVQSREARVLDYGCGEQVHADVVAAAAAELLLCDSAAPVRAALERRFAGNSRIKVLSPAQLEREPGDSIELIVANSMVQYLTAAELEGLLDLWRRLLTANGTLIVADVIPPGVGTASDVTALLRYAAHNGFLLAALAGLARTAVSPYRKLRRTLGIAQYTQDQFMQKLAAAGYVAERLPYNFEHNPARMTFRARLK